MRGDYIDTGHGQIRVWLTGDRPGVLVLPGIRWSGRPLAEEAALEAPDHPVAVADLPGVGGSAPGAAAGVGPAADALAEVAAAVGVHTVAGLDMSCALAAAVAGRVPGCRELVAVDPGYLVAARETPPPDLAPRADGTHLPRLWQLVRDAHLFPPGAPRSAVPGRAELPSPAALDRTVVAFAEHPEGFAALWQTWCRAAEDPFAGALPPTATVDSGGTGPSPVSRWLGKLSRAHGRPPAPAAPASAPERRTLPLADAPSGPVSSGAAVCGAPHGPSGARDTEVRREFLTTSIGQVHLRVAGDPAAPPLVALHSAPGSANLLEPLMRGLSGDFHVIAPDYPGNGQSDKPWRDPVDIGRLADAVAEVAERRAGGPVHLWGTHTGAVIALEMAVRRPDLVGRAVLEAPPLLPPEFTADILEHYLPPLRADRFGSHLVQAWGMRRDMFLFWPWYRDRTAASRPLRVPRARELHDWTVGLLQSGPTYHLSYAAAFRYPTRERLPELAVPALICAGPDDMLADNLPDLRAAAPDGTVIDTTPATCWYPDQDPAAVDATVRRYIDFLAGAR
ncbi:alpha/beta fold hydrolase [Actinomadura sp. KC345]|uniref:alpha/beta fold hydrolase n=1 Tax=Actinomadura sp. KC345 TaxID=2530371 RepID=UPI001049AD8B|nr:alpha/beta fold hydrolase [Actinomadura sp. KC345]TDC47465.1 alpha/beta fold hydrolase [Actinomadura sp. KC345]